MDRREDSDDRRKVERISSPPVREHFKQISMCLRFLLVLTFAGAVYSVARGFVQAGATAVDTSFGLFMGFIFGFITVLLFRYATAIQEYLATESVGNLDKVMERQSIFWIAISFLTLIWVIAFFIYSA